MERGRQFRTMFRVYTKVTAIASNLGEGYKPIAAYPLLHEVVL